MLKFSGLADLSSCFGNHTGMPPVHTSCFVATQLQRSIHPSTATSVRPATQYIICVESRKLLWHTTTHHSKVSYMQLLHVACAHECIDTETGKPSGVAWRHNAHSNLYWFTEFCYSACLSHFAAPFIVIPAKASNAENCVGVLLMETSRFKHQAATTTRDTQRCCHEPRWSTQLVQSITFVFFVNYKHSHGCWQGTGPI